MIVSQLALLALPTSVKILYDLYQVKKKKKPIHHRSEIEFTIGLMLFVATINAFLMNSEYNFLIRLIQGFVMSGGIFFQFFDWAMGFALHGNIYYTGEGKEAAKSDEFMGAIGPINSTFLRAVISLVAFAVYFQMWKIL